MEEEKICSNCKNWENYGDEEEGYCNSPGMQVGDVIERRTPVDGIVVKNCIGRFIIVKTGAQYGCVHWERRDKSK